MAAECGEIEHGRVFKDVSDEARCCPKPGVHQPVRELNKAEGSSTVIPDTKRHKFVAFGHATNLRGFVPGIAVAIPAAPVSSCMK